MKEKNNQLLNTNPNLHRCNGLELINNRNIKDARCRASETEGDPPSSLRRHIGLHNYTIRLQLLVAKFERSLLLHLCRRADLLLLFLVFLGFFLLSRSAK